MKWGSDLRLNFSSKAFVSMLRSVLLILAIPIIINIIIAQTSLYTIDQEIHHSRQVMLERVAKEIDRSFQNSYKTLVQIQNNDIIASYGKSKTRKYWTEGQIVTTLKKMIGGEDSIEMAFLYLPCHELVLSTVNGSESAYFIKSNYGISEQEWKERLRSSWVGNHIQIKGKNGTYKNLTVSSLYNSYGDDAPVIAAVQLSNDYLARIISDLHLADNDKIMVYSQSGVVVSNFGSEEEEALIREIEGARQFESKKIRIGMVTYEVSAKYSSTSGISVIYGAPSDIFHSSVTFNKVYVWITIVFCILFSLIMSLLVTNRNYAPIKKILKLFDENDYEEAVSRIRDDYLRIEQYAQNYIQSNRALASTVKQYEKDFQNMYLEKIMQGKVRYLPGIEEGSKIYNLEFRSPYFVLVLYEVILQDEEEGLLTEEQEDSYKENVQKDLLNAYVENNMEYVSRFYIIEETNCCFCVLNGEAEDAGEFRQRIARDNDEVMKEMEKAEGVYCESYISDIFKELNQLNNAYLQVNARKERQKKEIVGAEKSLSINRVLEVIKADVSDSNLSVASLADELGVTPSYLSRYFKQQMGSGVLDYIHHYRISLAKEIIGRNPEIRVKEVADRTGFYNVSAFIRVFKKVENMTPGQYREKFLV